MLSFFHGSVVLSRAVVCRTLFIPMFNAQQRLFIPMFNAQQRLNRRIFNTQQSNIEGYLIVSRG
jgi:hypothetical protein